MNIIRKLEGFYMETSKHYFYVVECRDASFYTGYTNNLEHRVKMHNQGKGAKYTRGRTPVELIYYETFETKTEAMQAEYRFKQLTRKGKQKWMTKEEI
jgi:putative endonuclease